MDGSDGDGDDVSEAVTNSSTSSPSRKKEKKSKKAKSKKEKKKKKSKKRKTKTRDKSADDDGGSPVTKKRRRSDDIANNSDGTVTTDSYFPFEYQHILAPMVGASELAFRLLCRNYGATLSYTPMMSASQFVKEAAARGITPVDEADGDDAVDNGIGAANVCEYQTIPADRPLVCHFSANDPEDFANAARLVRHTCDAVDLNLGCPQRTAYLGHFGSYLLGEKDRKLICDIVKAGREAVDVPIFVKIRLLDKVEETVELCRQLREAGASLIAIHARCE